MNPLLFVQVPITNYRRKHIRWCSKYNAPQQTHIILNIVLSLYSLVQTDFIHSLSGHFADTREIGALF